MRFVFALWILVLFVVSVFPVGFKVKLHTSGPLHDVGHYLAFVVTGILLWLIMKSPLSKVLGFIGGVAFVLSQEWTENWLYHAGFEWKDVGNDVAGLISGYALMILVGALVEARMTPRSGEQC